MTSNLEVVTPVTTYPLLGNFLKLTLDWKITKKYSLFWYKKKQKSLKIVSLNIVKLV